MNFQKLKEKNNSNNNNKKNQLQLIALLQFTKNFFFQAVHERRCGCSCFYVRAYLIPDLWSKK